MLGEREGTVVAVRPFDLHGVVYSDVTVAYDDGASEAARLGPEAVPDGLQPGERVLVMRAANLILSIRRPA